MNVLALDQAMVTSGWAVFKDDKLQSCGNFTVKKSLPIETRLYQIQSNITDLIYKNEPIDLVVFEGIQQQGNVETFKKLAYAQAAIMLLCYQLDIRYKIYTPSEWRKLLGGGFGKKREEQKEYAIQLVKNKCKKEVDSDTADAICIGMAAIKEKDSKPAFGTKKEEA